jgi:tetratricopeptide (TPR) repeat protein
MRSRTLVVLLCSTPVLLGAAPPVGPDRPLTAEERQHLAGQYQRTFAQYQTARKAGRLQEALEAAKQVLALQEQLQGPRSETVAIWLEGIARQSSAAGADEQAIAYAERTHRLRQRMHPEGDWRVLDSRLNLEEIRQHAKRDTAARQQLLRAAQLNEQVFQLWQQGKSRAALPLAEEAVAIRRRLLGQKHRLYALSLFNLGAQYKELYQVRQAEDCYLRARDIRKEVLGEKHPDYADSLNNLGLLYHVMGEHARALPLHLQALDIRKQTLGEKHPAYAASLNNLGSLYQDMGEYAQALALYLRARDIRRRTLGEIHQHHATSLFTLATLYQVMGEYGKALPLFRQALAIYTQTLGEKHPLYATALNGLASLHQERGEYAQALPLFLQALDIRKQSLGEKHPNSIQSLMNLARLYQAMGEYARARPLYEQARASAREVLGEKHPNYALSLHNLAVFYQDLGEYDLALPLLLQAADIWKETRGEKHPEHAASLSSLALLYRDMGEYGKAAPLFRQSLDLRKQAWGEKHPAYARGLNNLALLYQDMGEHARALPLLLQARDIHRQKLGEKHPQYAQSLENLAWNYQGTGEYARALPLLLQARDIYRQSLGERHPRFAHSLNNLALLYLDMGEYARALPLYEQALAIRKGTLGEKHPEYAQSLHNLAILYRAMGEQARALPLFLQAVDLRKQTLGEKHPQYANSLNSLAVLYKDMGEHGKALPLLVQARDVRKEALGEKHPEYANSLHNLAMLYHEMGESGKALPLFLQARDLYQQSLGERHPHYANCLSNLSALEWEDGKPELASKHLAQALQIMHRHLDDTFSALSERQRLALLAQSRRYLDSFLSVGAVADVPAAALHQAVLAWKGMVTARAAEETLARDQAHLLPLLEQLRLQRAALAQLVQRPPHPEARLPWRERLASVQQEIDHLESQLAQKSLAFHVLRTLDSKTLAAAIPSGAALVDLLEYHHRIPDRRLKGKGRFERRLAAFVLVKGQEVVRLDLGAAEPITAAVQSWRESVQSGRSVDEKAARQLRSLVWDKLAPALKGCSTVVVAPDGVLCALPWCALPGSTPGSYLIEELAIAQVPSAHHLLLPPGKNDNAGLLVLGGLDYGKRTSAAGSWPALPGTGLEAAQVRRLFQERRRAEGKSLLLDGERVAKEHLLAALLPDRGEPRLRWLHLATHGYFQAPPKEARSYLRRGGLEMFALAGQESGVPLVNPLLYSGLVLSGANQNAENGVLTALEVSNLDLRGCELVVLSACETGLGTIASGEGLLGLQRGFHVAGARTVVSSLWSVSDPATSVLMEQFYKNLWGEKPLGRLEALRQAQLFVLNHPDKVRERAGLLSKELLAKRGSSDELRGKGKEIELGIGGDRPESRKSHPAWWAAFVLSGDTGVVKP